MSGDDSDSEVISNINKNGGNISTEFEDEYRKEWLANSDLSKAKFSEEDVPITEYEHIFRAKEDQVDLDSKIDDWEWEEDWFNKDHSEELFEEDKVDWSDEIGILSQKLKEQYIRGLSGIEGGHSQNTFWPETQSEESSKTRLGSPTRKEEDEISSLEEIWIGSEETLRDPGNTNPSPTKGRRPDKESV